ncbi:MAG: winged helix-turn-helix domain-containing protein [Thermodesulfobacteriota bacterium]|jgi:DNA-binding winged helix-turn-helix (wHTH) protein
MQERVLSFPPFRLDLANEQLWREQELIPLRPKTFAVLRYLGEHAGRLVSKEALLHAVWGDTHVSEDGLRDYIRELRQALADDPRTPRSIETVHGRGYRLLSEGASSQYSVASSTSEDRRRTANSLPDQLTIEHWPLTTSLPLPDKP